MKWFCLHNWKYTTEEALDVKTCKKCGLRKTKWAWQKFYVKDER